jgi:predicted metal-dependent phosphoesterase TrpH
VRLDLHCHTVYSNDNYLEPRDLIREARVKGLDGVVVTEHHSYEASWPVERLARKEGFLVLRGLEVSTDRGHLLVYGVTSDAWNGWGRNNYLEASKVIAAVAQLGGVAVPAHPYRVKDLYPLGDGIYELSGIAAVEALNGKNEPAENELAVAAALRLGLPQIGGSDCHTRSEVGTCHTVFDCSLLTLEDLVREIRAGRCRPGEL